MNKRVHGGSVRRNELERGISTGSNSSSSTNSSAGYNNTIDTSMMSSLSSNSSTSSSTCVSQQRAANIDESFQKHFQNLSALQRPQMIEELSESPGRKKVLDVTSSCSSSNSLSSLDRRLCKTLPRKLTKGIIGASTASHKGMNGGSSTLKRHADDSTLEKINQLHSSPDKRSEFDKRNSDPYLDVSTSDPIEMCRKKKNYSTLAHGSQRHSFGGLVVHRVVPPPAKYKAVHFAPNVEVSKRDKTPSPEETDKVPDIPIPTEGLPTRPARAPPKLPNPRTSSAANNTASVIIPNTSETVPIVVKNISDRPPLGNIASSATNSGRSNLSDNLAITRRSSSLTFNGGGSASGNKK